MTPHYVLTSDGVTRPAEDFNPMSLNVGDEYDVVVPGQAKSQWYRVTGWGTGERFGPMITDMGFRDPPRSRSPR